MTDERIIKAFFQQGRNVRKTARAINISEEELCSLLRNPEFRKELEQYRRQGAMNFEHR